MKPILETRPPFVVKVFENYFHVSWDGLSENADDEFSYENIKSVKINKGKFSTERSLFGVIAQLVADSGDIIDTSDSDEMEIEFKTGQIEKRYLKEVASSKIEPAIELICKKILDFDSHGRNG